MSVIGIAGTILMQVPPEYRTRLLRGGLKLAGSALRDTKNGRIVGFLQEAAPVAQHIGHFGIRASKKFGATTAATGSPQVGAAAVAVDFAMQVGQLAQGEAIRAGVGRVEGGVGRLEQAMERVEPKLDEIGAQLGALDEGMALLQNLGVANLVMGAAGLGVSMVGFGIMAMKLDKVQASIHGISDQLGGISAKIDSLRQDAVDADFIEIQSLCRLYEEGWGFADRGRSEQQWLRVSHEARTFQDRFIWRARELMNSAHGNVMLADQMLDAVALASGLRVTALAACNESALAISVSTEAALQLETLTGAIGLMELSSVHLPEALEEGSADYELALVSAREAARPLLQKIRHREAALATRAAPLPLLESRGCAPREWLDEARIEQQSSVLMLKADDVEGAEG